ncbi:PorP/SprF family type IX secretion system membrane protein [Aureibacter tunicatorum]|uniref:Type IX secretion system PorP/SprF family membrane protein n=1 Tax=Aureibacter tunicatorum TaxID=866807 RepID=A0AAE3XR95_9BACT|nr:PorP/SprF family type IX secretion system membrane protein [Aureibacter tunicatorum]MDR6241682.1 type IX secretion system PorP/SprF family membrane protein [Aureibacter tunicatorum]BDD07332.1 hypothetical protein AUTU_48150 [Aureibacter tunicatorum]
MKRKLQRISSISFLMILFLCGFIVSVNAQDATFSQYYASPLMLNPALSGSYITPVVGVNYKKQWRDSEYPRDQMHLGVIYPIIPKSGYNGRHLGGVGLSVFDESAGVDKSFNTTSIRVSGSYNVQLDGNGLHQLTFAIQGGIVRKYINMANLFWGEQAKRWASPANYGKTTNEIQNEVPGPDYLNESTTFPVIGAGVMWYHSEKTRRGFIKRSFYGGVAADNLNVPDESLVQDGTKSSLPILLKVHGGALFNTPFEDWQVSPNFLFQYQNSLMQYNLGVYFSYMVSSTKFRDDAKRLVFGGWYRVGDAAIFNVGFETKEFNVGFSYDMNTTYLRYNTNSGGALEVSFAYKFKTKKKRKFATPLM